MHFVGLFSGIPRWRWQLRFIIRLDCVHLRLRNSPALQWSLLRLVSLYHQIHQEQFSAGDMTENIAEIPVVHEQVIVQAIPRVVGSLPPVEEFTGSVYDQVHQEQFAAGEMTENMVEIPVVHQQVIVGMRPERLVDARGPQGGLERVRLSAVEPPIPGCVVLVQEPEAHDSTTTRYLLKKALQRKEEEAEKKEEVDELLAIRYSSGRRRSGPGFLSSSAPLPGEEEEEEEEEEEASSSHLLSAFAVQKTVEIPQSQFFNIVVVFSFRAAEADSHGPDSSADH